MTPRVRRPESPLATARIRAGLGQTELAAELGVHVETIRRWEAGARISRYAAAALCARLPTLTHAAIEPQIRR